jgi:ABC-type bacteriocin/lantibiotic exporter with double-glycine peptidase domain
MVMLAPVIWVVNENYRREMSRRLRKVQQSWSRVASTLAESVSGIRVTQAFVRQDVNAGFFRKLINVHGENNVGVAQASAVFVPLLQLKSQLFLGAMALLSAYGALSWHGWLHMEVGDLVMFFFLANLFFDPVQVIGNQLNQALMAMAGAERLFRMLDQEPEWRTRRTPNRCRHHRPRGISGGPFRISSGPARAPDISFTAEPGQTVALVGHTGSGKTTLAGLLQKFYLPTSGCVLVDGPELERRHQRFAPRADGQRAAEQFLFCRHGARQHPLRPARSDGSRRARDPGKRWIASTCSTLAAGIAFARWPSAARRCRSASGNWYVSRAPCWRTRASWCSTRRPAPLTRSPRRGCSGRWRFCCAGGRRSWWRTA